MKRARSVTDGAWSRSRRPPVSLKVRACSTRDWEAVQRSDGRETGWLTDLTQLAEEELELVRQKRTQLHGQIVAATAELEDLRDQLAKARACRCKDIGNAKRADGACTGRL